MCIIAALFLLVKFPLTSLCYFRGYTGTAASITADGPDYLLIKLVPSQWRARIYITGLGEGPTALDEVRMEGEGIMKPGDIAPDPVESIGNLPLP